MLINVEFSRFNEPFQTGLKFAWRVLLWSPHRCPPRLSLTQSSTSVSLVYTPGASSSAQPSPQLTTPTRLYRRRGYSVHMYSGECHLYWPPGSEDVTRGPPLSP